MKQEDKSPAKSIKGDKEKEGNSLENKIKKNRKVLWEEMETFVRVTKVTRVTEFVRVTKVN